MKVGSGRFEITGLYRVNAYPRSGGVQRGQVAISFLGKFVAMEWFTGWQRVFCVE